MVDEKEIWVVGLKTIWMGHDGRTLDGSHDEVVVGMGVWY